MTTISEERRLWNAVPGHPAMRLRSQWGAARSYTDARTVIEPATRVFIHITVTNPASYSTNDSHARAVERIGISRFPNTGISYNRLIMPDGSLYEAQPIGRRGAHTVNDFKRSTCSTSGCPGRGSSLTAPDWNLNYVARAYVFCGIESTPVSSAVVETFARAIYTDYKAGFITKGAAQNIHGHRCVSAKSCPEDRMWARMDEIQALVNKLIAGAVPPPPQEDELPTVKEVWEGYTVGSGPQQGDTPVAMLAEAATFSLDARNNSAEVLANQAKVLSELAAIRAAVGADPVDEGNLAHQLAPLLAPTLVAAVVAEIGEAAGVTAEQVEAAQERVLRRVLGSLNSDAPA